MNADTAMDAVAADADGPDDPVCTVDATPANAEPLVRIREEHNISRRDIDPDALKVLYRLARNEFIAYLVGGGVRDLLLGRKPKDFDISTNAKPEQIRSLFRNCILIGRRFRLAHVRYGDKIIETSTFRSTPKCIADPADPDADLFQRDDNLFGTPQEDAMRRDFTVNGLFYDIESFSIIDYVGGMEDLRTKRIRSIGDPCIRFREDPVRMIRAVRFASRLDFTLDPGTEDAIHKHGEELAKAAPARLLEEITRLFAFSAGERAVRLLLSTGLLKVILPEVSDRLASDKANSDLFWRRLRALDQGDTVLPDATPALIFSVLLLEPLKARLERDWNAGDPPRLRFDKVHSFLEPLALRLCFPRKLVDRIVHMYLNQYRFFQNDARGKRGSLSNFVTQDAFHESLALAEILLTAEGGQQSRLNQWREMLAERIYGKDEMPARQHHNGGNGHDRRQGRQAEIQPEREDDAEGEHKLSRSARRRRNKRLRRDHPGGEAGTQRPAEEVSAHDNAAQSVAEAITPEPETTEQPKTVAAERVQVEPPAAKSAKGRAARRGGRNRKKETEQPSSAPEARQEASEPLKPLTAAAFWSAPEPAPAPSAAAKPEPEKAKKKRGGKKKAESGKAPANAADSAAGEQKPLPPDRADEADTPMHWLDEI